MANENRSRQKQTPDVAKDANPLATPDAAKAEQASTKLTAKRSGAKSNAPRVGGTAVPGAKSTLPKQIPGGNNPAQQQAESYNRDMRRRMQHLGTGPQSDNQKVTTLQDQRRRRIERRKQRVEEERARLRRSTPGGSVALGRRNLYFIFGVVALIVLIIVVFVILRAINVIH